MRRRHHHCNIVPQSQNSSMKLAVAKALWENDINKINYDTCELHAHRYTDVFHQYDDDVVVLSVQVQFIYCVYIVCLLQSMIITDGGNTL